MSGRSLLHHQVWLKCLYKLRLKNLWGIYLHACFRNLGMSLIGIFIPIYVYQLTGSFLWVFLFYLIYHASDVLTAPLAGWFMRRFGVDKTAIVGTFLRVLFLYLMILAKDQPDLLNPAAIIWGMTIPFAWLPYHYTIVAEEEKYGKFGSAVAKIAIIEKITAALAPFIGGLIIYFSGFKALYGVGLMIVVISLIPMLIDSFDRRGMRFDFDKVITEIFNPKLWPITLSLAGSSLEEKVYNVLRPLIMYVGLITVAQLGGIESISTILSLIITWWAGQWVDKKGFGIMKIGVAVNALGLLLFPFLHQGWAFLIFNSIYLIVSVLVWTPFNTAIYEYACKNRRLEFFVAREIILNSAAALFCALLFLGFWQHFSWQVLFGIGSLGLIMCLAIIKGVSHAQSEYKFKVNPATSG
ncbi:hypothetical protein A2160_04315 [Candidatus Beckwithbacteria bacterium RBG_13_42_9]|uniref:Major facilitator superfamily (MFS) profile domain-containing protein n=1 Tax=Candidatus Beckwithbacteria bacterium RBG_13_42_9 TaxID=1797457 RepID=A0A1F5E6M8_9BACT|nr:MAG: hypothetical protein A2160_04315 [Candidatus Beckwithbacteria bacterium RBG_13_42_9]